LRVKIERIVYLIEVSRSALVQGDGLGLTESPLKLAGKRLHLGTPAAQSVHVFGQKGAQKGRPNLTIDRWLWAQRWTIDIDLATVS
jgi:hypothetical protein